MHDSPTIDLDTDKKRKPDIRTFYNSRCGYD